MVDFLKIQINILKAADKSKTRYNGTLNYQVLDDCVAVTIDGCEMYFIPKVFYYLDNDRVFDKAPANSFDKIKNSTYNLQDVAKTNSIEIMGKFQTQVFEFPDSTKMYINCKLLKDFDGIEGASYKAVNCKSPLFIYQYDELVGVICPVKRA